MPLQWAAKGVIVAQFDKDDVETLGLVKMDILGLRMHSAIAEAVRRIEARTGERIAPWELPRDDPAVYELISEARTIGVFQLESSGQRNLATRLRERDFEDVIAAISLFRPGPLQAEMIAPFIRRRHGREKATVPHPALWPALKGTYGVILYQEQVIETASIVAGFSLAEADLLRRAMTHDRSLEEMDAIGRDFVEKAVARGVPRAAAEEIFRQLRGLRRLRLQQGARRLLRDRLQRQRLAQGPLPGRVLLRHPQQPADGLLLAARGAERRAALGTRGAAGRRQRQREGLLGRARGAGAARGPAATSRR